jgi:hypothetical protein
MANNEMANNKMLNNKKQNKPMKVIHEMNANNATSPQIIQNHNKIARHAKNYKRIKAAKEAKLKKMQSDLQTYRHPYHIYYEDEGEIVAYQFLEKKIQLLQDDLCYLDEEYQAFKVRNGMECSRPNK